MTDAPRLHPPTRVNQPACMAELPRRNSTPRPSEAPRRRGPADPVLALMYRHYDLCARAVDPLEIAAALEADGVTDRAAARFRHRDVFSLAEELYARVPREPAPGAAEPRPPQPAVPDRLTARQTALHLLPGLLAVAGVTASQLGAALPYAAAAGGVFAFVLALPAARAAVRRGPLRAPGGGGRALWTLWLLAFAIDGAQAVTALLGADSSGPATGLPGFLAAAFALLPAAWCARRYALRTRAWLAGSHGLAEFAAEVRPLLIRTLALFGLAVLVLLAASYATLAALVPASAARHPDPVALPVALGGTALLCLLLFTAQLLAAHGFPAVAAAGTGAACAVEAAAVATAALQRLPGLQAAGRPLHVLLQAAGPGSVQAVACSAAALALIACALPALGRVSAHAGADPTDPTSLEA